MRIFSLMNILLVGVVMATHQGAHLDNLLSPEQAKWLNAGAKVAMTGTIDVPTIGMIANSARAHGPAAMPAAIEHDYQPFNFAAESRGAGNAAPTVIVPVNYSAPVPVINVSPQALDQAFANVLANINS